MIPVYRHQDEQKRIREATMKNLVTFFCIFLCSCCLRCYSCFSPSSSICNVCETECLGDQCMTTSEYFYTGENKYKSIYKGCTNKTLCKANSAGMTSNMAYRFYVNCCNGELCNTNKYELPKEDPTPNGVICSDAQCNNTLEECKSDKKINCTGSMNRCVEYRALERNPDGTVEDYSVKGCVNTDACRFNFDIKIGTEEIRRVLLKC